jgi:hypothetical protein
VRAGEAGASRQLRSDQAIDVREKRGLFIVVVKEPRHVKRATFGPEQNVRVQVPAPLRLSDAMRCAAAPENPFRNLGNALSIPSNQRDGFFASWRPGGARVRVIADQAF